nr:ABC transporter ATP-binding protein [uncultured bacterium]
MQLDIVNVSKRYPGGKTGVDGVTMRIGHGVLGLLGPNGAGKSTLMRMVATITRPTSGEVRWDGTDVVAHPDRLRRVLGYLPQDFGVYPHLSAREFLSYLAAAKGLSRRSADARIDELLQLLNLTSAGKRPLGKHSGGMRQRVGIAQALLADPSLLIVDEPTVGLDPEERAGFRAMLSELATDRVVILSTHIVSDVDSTADGIAVMSEGRLLLHTTPEELLRRVNGQVWQVVAGSEEVPELRTRHAITRMVRTKDGVLVRLLSADTPRAGAVQVAPELEDAYLAEVRGLTTLRKEATL